MMMIMLYGFGTHLYLKKISLLLVYDIVFKSGVCGNFTTLAHQKCDIQGGVVGAE